VNHVRPVDSALAGRAVGGSGKGGAAARRRRHAGWPGGRVLAHWPTVKSQASINAGKEPPTPVKLEEVCTFFPSGLQRCDNAAVAAVPPGPNSVLCVLQRCLRLPHDQWLGRKKRDHLLAIFLQRAKESTALWGLWELSAALHAIQAAHQSAHSQLLALLKNQACQDQTRRANPKDYRPAAAAEQVRGAHTLPMLL
jgi:hypothetical protein